MTAAHAITNRRSAEAAISLFVQRQLHRADGAIDWLRTANHWRNPHSISALRCSPTIAAAHAAHCDTIARRTIENAIYHAERIRALDATRRGSAIAAHTPRSRPIASAAHLLTIARAIAGASTPTGATA